MDSLLLYFVSPNKNMFEQMRFFMGKLPIAAAKKAYEEYRPIYGPSELSVGSADYVIDVMKKNLASDYRDKLAELESVPWTFDYALDESRMDKSDLVSLFVATRLIAPTADSGNILYGIDIYRIGEDEFLFPPEYR